MCGEGVCSLAGMDGAGVIEAVDVTLHLQGNQATCYRSAAACLLNWQIPSTARDTFRGHVSWQDQSARDTMRVLHGPSVSDH